MRRYTLKSDRYSHRENQLTPICPVKIQKNDETGEILNPIEFNNFIAEIVFYLVKYNSVVLIKEGRQKTTNNFGIFASQREIFDSNYIVGLSSEVNKLSESTVLSTIGENILQEWQLKWNKKDGRILWDYGDCWPIYLFRDHNFLKTWFNSYFNVRIRNLLRDHTL